MTRVLMLLGRLGWVALFVAALLAATVDGGW
jgi:hypothetical protein